MSIEAYITIHDSALIEKCEEEGHFSHISHTYLFVGPREVRVSDNVKVIVSRDYSPNYEQYPHFYDFTGWFVLANNNLIKTDNAIFLQYDHVDIHSDIETVTESALKKTPMVSFVPASSYYFTLDMPNFYKKQIEAVWACGFDLPTLIKQKPFAVWPSTQGTAWETSEFNKFMKWFEPAFDVLKDELYAGHLAERMVHTYLMCTDQTFIPIEGMVRHQSLDSHGTMAHSAGNFESFNSKSLTFGR